MINLFGCDENVLIAKIDNLITVKQKLLLTRNPSDTIHYMNPKIHQKLFELLLGIVYGEQFFRMS